MAGPPAPRVVELVRVSTQRQADQDTPEVQRRALDALRKRRPGRLVERIEAPGVSGALPLDRRPDLQRLAALAKAKAFDELRVYAIDRLTRADDPRERMAVYGMALDAGAVIVDSRGHAVDPASEMGELDYYLQTLFASRERRKILQRTHDGMLRALSEGRLCHGSPPYGRRYDRIAQKWLIHEPEAAIYREILERVSSGEGTRKICADLTARGVPPPRAARWGKSTILRLVKLETCIGRYRVAGVVQRIPPICSEEEWRGARLALKRGRTRGGPTPTRDALLRGVLRCAHCGRRMRVRSDDARSPVFYCCPLAHELPPGSKPCPERARHRVDLVDSAVVAELGHLVSSPKALASAMAEANEGSDVSRIRYELERARKRAEAADSREAKTLRLLDVLSETTARARLAEIAADRDAAAEALQAAQERLRAAEAPKADTRSLVASLRALAAAGDWRGILEALVPDREPYRVTLSSSRELRIEGIARAGGLAQSAPRSGQSAGCAILRFSASLG